MLANMTITNLPLYKHLCNAHGIDRLWPNGVSTPYIGIHGASYLSIVYGTYCSLHMSLYQG